MRERNSNEERMRNVENEERLLTFHRASYRSAWRSAIDFTWPSTCSRHVQILFRTHLMIVGYSDINTPRCTFLKKYMIKCIAARTGLSHCGSSFRKRKREFFFYFQSNLTKWIREINYFQRIRYLIKYLDILTIFCKIYITKFWKWIKLWRKFTLCKFK